jgi:hypothetical protein
MTYSVWVDGVEINSYYYKTREQAIKEYKYWKNKRYKDVYIEEITSENSNFYNLREFKRRNDERR